MITASERVEPLFLGRPRDPRECLGEDVIGVADIPQQRAELEAPSHSNPTAVARLGPGHVVGPPWG